MRKLLLPTLLLVVIGNAVGCGNANLPPTAPVSGSISFKGKPIAGGTITFHPEDGNRPGYGEIGSDGSFTISTFRAGDGAIIGKHIVTVEALGENSGKEILPGSEEELNIVPDRYRHKDQSPLRFEVRSGENMAPFILKE